MEMDKAISELEREITSLFPIEQMTISAVSYRRSKVYGLIFNHVAKAGSARQAVINELSRKLYIAEKKISDDALETDVDPAGFNK